MEIFRVVWIMAYNDDRAEPLIHRLNDFHDLFLPIMDDKISKFGDRVIDAT
jgi:hypothetical protein